MARVASKKSWGIIWQDVDPLILPLAFMTFSAAHSPAASPGAAPTDNRRDLLAAWLGSHAGQYALDLATLAPASADASFRRYFRLASAGAHGASLIAVDAPPPEKSREFAQIAQLL
ncbi:hypothetical protein ACLFKT_24470, partial [Paraburkholderia sp. BR14261]